MPGFCRSCDKSTPSMHKCGDCGRYVFIDPSYSGQLDAEIKAGKEKIKAKYADKLKFAKRQLKVEESREERNQAEIERLEDDIDHMNGLIKAEIEAYLAPGVNK